MGIKNPLTETELHQITTIERVTSALSIGGCIFIVLTFCLSNAFHKPINRLVFFASLGNIITNVATFISRAGIPNPDGGLCQLQGFLIQMFMCADAYWTFAMAMNVYLTFFWKFDAERLRRIERWYWVGCYGVPLIPALIYCFIRAPGKTRVYGNAQIWCWVSSDWDALRIATFYGPVWVAIFLTFVIYFRAGSRIFKQRSQLRNFGTSSNYDADYPKPALDNPFTSTKTTEVHVTSESALEAEQPIDLSRLGRHEPSRDRPLYSVTVSSNAPPNYPSDESDTIAPPPTGTTPSALPYSERPRRNISNEANRATWNYTKVAVLFFTAMLVTWIPSSANRVYSVVHPDLISKPLQFASAFVLPLQGFWNAVIYTNTSWAACRLVFGSLLEKETWQNIFKRKPNIRTEIPSYAMHGRLHRIGSIAKDNSSTTESMTELASRPVSEGPSR